MLYVYHEDCGQMLIFDMGFVTRSVRELKIELERTNGIPYRHQVLYVSGGQIMDGKVTVGKYQAGTDNNPIWLVDNRCYSQPQPPKAYIPAGPEDISQETVDNSMLLPTSYETIVTRSQIAMRFHDIGKEELKICDTLVKDQHFQHQGWLALKCTLEDKGFALEKNMKGFQKIFEDFLEQRKDALQIMESFETTNQLIKKIPIPDCLENYASGGSDKLLKESSVHPESVRQDSSLTSCIDRLEKSDMSSGPPSGNYVRDYPYSGSPSATDNQYSHHSSVYKDPGSLGSSPDISRFKLPRQTSDADFDLRSQVLKPDLSTSPSSGVVRPKQTTLSRRDSSLSQSPDAPLSVSIPRPSTQDNLKRALQQDTYISENKTMKLLLSPTSSGPSSPSNKTDDKEEEKPDHQYRTLSDWIKGNATKDPIEVVKTELEDKFVKLSPELRDLHLKKCQDILKALDNKSMKEFKGLDKRLAGLEQIMMQMRALSVSQSDMTQGFLQNQQRVRAERDQSVLPVMCDSHKKQLSVMMDNHRKIGDIKRRITAAKQELCGVIHARIRWIMHMEERLREANHDIVMTQGMIRKLANYMKTLKQVDSTPELFAQGVVEGYRRRKFSQRFLSWAGSWAEENSTMYTEELERRRRFNDSLSGHFLMRLFTGYGEEPPSFATKAPEPFDTKLPEIDEKDIEMIREEVPEIAHLLSLPVESAIGRQRKTKIGFSQTSASLCDLRALETSATKRTTTTTVATAMATISAATSPGSDDIVVLNANGEQGVLTPSPEHRPDVTKPHVIEQKQVSPGDLTQSVEVIHRDDTEYTEGVELEKPVEGAMNIPGAKHGTARGLMKGADILLSESPQPPRSLSLNEDYSYGDDSLGTGSPPFQSFKTLSLPDTHSALKSPFATPPDLDEYATADFTTDFFIEESIPSAMSSSTPDKTIAELQVQLQEKSSAMEQQQSELEEVKSKLGKMEVMLSSVRSSCKEMMAGEKVGQLKQDVQELKSQALSDQSDMQQGLQSLSQSVTQLINRLTDENAMLESRVTDLTKEADGLKQQADDMKKLADDSGEAHALKLQETVDQAIETCNDEWQKKLDIAKADFETQLNEEIKQRATTHAQTLSNVQSQKDELDIKVKKIVLDLEERARLHETAENERDTLKEELRVEKDRYSVMQNHVVELEKKCKDLQEALDSEKETCSQMQNKMAELENENSESKIRFTELEKQTVQEKEKDLLEREQFYNSECDRLKTEYENQVHQITEQLEKMQDSTSLQIEELNSKLNETAELKSDLETKMSELQKQLDAKSEELRIELEKCDQMTKSQLLEHEVELEKVKSDLNLELEEKDDTIKSLQNELANKDKHIEDLKTSHEKAKEELLLEFQNQKDEIVKSLVKEKEESVSEKENVIKEELVKLHSEDLEKKLKEKETDLEKLHDEAKEEIVKQHQADLKALADKHTEEKKKLECEYEAKLAMELKSAEEAHASQMAAKAQEFEKTKEEIQDFFKQEKEKEAKEIKDKITFDLYKRMTEARSDIEAKEKEIENLKEMLSEAEKNLAEIKDSGDYIMLSKHGEIIAQMKEAWEEKRVQAINEALTEVQVKHAEDVEALIDRLEKEKEDSLSSMQTSYTAEKQVLFNEALNKAIAAKDAVIEELTEKETQQRVALETLTAELDSLKSDDKLDKLQEDLSKAKEAEKQALTAQRSSEQELSKLKQQMQQNISGMGLLSMTQSLFGGGGSRAMTESVGPLSDSGAQLREKNTQLETEVKQQNEEISSLRAQLRDKMGAAKDKVSIHTFTTGDIVLLCLDEKYDHYVVFTVGQYLHFLHSDCYQALGLTTGPGETRKLWVLAELTDKEYCQARKAQNRFKVPMGTKFFRVRCRPYHVPTPKVKASSAPISDASSQLDQSTLTIGLAESGVINSDQSEHGATGGEVPLNTMDTLTTEKSGLETSVSKGSHDSKS